MHECCPVCGLRYEREEGYFFGSMYISYPLSSVLMLLGLWIAYLALPHWELHWLLLLIVLPCYLPLVPVVFRYSRVIWLYFDRWVSPSSGSTPASWEKWQTLQESSKDAL